MLRLRAIFVSVAAAVLACLLHAQAQAQNWPNRPVKIIAPFAAGGAADTLGRIIADHLSTAFHQQFFVENRGGAGGMVGAQAGAAAEPDGYTLVISSIASNVISPVFNANAGYDGLRDFTHIAYLGGPPVVMIVHPSLGVTTYKDFVALARQRKEPLSFISPGTGSHGFLVGEYIARQENYKVSHIPYKGAGPALTDLVAGHVKLGTMTFSSAAEQVRAGKVLALAVSTEKRIPNFPDIPTFREVGQDSGGGDVVLALGTGAPAERHRGAAQPRDAQGHAAARGAEAAGARRHRDAADVAGRIHQIHRGRDRALGATGQAARRQPAAVTFRGTCSALILRSARNGRRLAKHACARVSKDEGGAGRPHASRRIAAQRY